jgi:fatty-acyl-CoA synthase
MTQQLSNLLGRNLPIRQNKSAIIMIGGSEVTFDALEACSNQGAQLFRSLGLQSGDHIAILLENSEHFHQVCWAAHRSGLHYTPISIHLKTNEINHIINDCEATLLITSTWQRERGDIADADLDSVVHRFVIGKSDATMGSWNDAIAEMPTDPIPDEILGRDLIYSSGTTGLPKGIQRKLPTHKFGDPEPIERQLAEQLGFSNETRYLVVSPLYHSLPLRHSLLVQGLGGSTVIMNKFDAEQALGLIEKYRITHCFMVPTMFVRLLELPEQVRASYDLSSLQSVVHAAAPCPVAVKQAMLDWLGPIIIEIYGNTEECGFTAITSQEWITHPGSVGKPLACKLHILDDHDRELNPGESGTVWIEGCNEFSYHNAPDKTAESRNSRGWRTVGDIGYVDADGYLYLSGRKNFTIITGGVNVYPSEVEELLRSHPKVSDAAVFGIPDPDLGEQVKAVVQLKDQSESNTSLAAELIGFCKARLSSIKCPKSVDFDCELPYSTTGKLLKRQLQQKYSH